MALGIPGEKKSGNKHRIRVGLILINRLGSFTILAFEIKKLH